MKIQNIQAGITLRSLCATIMVLIFAGIYTQLAEVTLSLGDAPAEQVLPVVAFAPFFLILLAGALLYSLFKVRILTRAEMLCVVFSTLMAVPLMTQGMWHRLIGLVADAPRTGSFYYMDAVNDSIWPHGKNILRGKLTRDAVQTSGNVVWEDIEYEEGKSALLPVLENKKAGEVSYLEWKMSLKEGIQPTEAHLASVLLRGTDMGAGAVLRCQAFEDGSDQPVDMFSASTPDDFYKKTVLHKMGFVRLGIYAAKFSNSTKQSLTLRFVLDGAGKVALADPKFFSVDALESVYTGRQLITKSEWDSLPESQRSGSLVVRPESLLSLEGVKFFFSGYIPFRAWLKPILFFGSFIFLLVGGFLAINIVMRKQWIENERYLLPNTHIPAALFGFNNEDENKSFLTDIWSNKIMWAGVVFALISGGLYGWSFYNPSIPNWHVNIALSPFFIDPSWGQTWNTTFAVSLLLVSVAIFFDLNILLSLVVGYWIYRSEFFIGKWFDIGSDPNYPWRQSQQLGGYVGYFLVVLFFARKYLTQILCSLFRRGNKDELDIMSTRSAVLLFLAMFGGSLLWAHVAEVSMLPIVVYFATLLMIGFVAAKLRSECGLFSGYFTPENAMLLLALCGGMASFGISGLMVALLFSGFLCVSVFLFIPGAQMELIQLARNARVNPRHVIYSCLLGLFGGLIVGGWVFLSNAYSLGGDNIPYGWAFKQTFYFSSFKIQLAAATNAMNSGAVSGGIGYDGIVAGIAALATIAVAALRQIFSGFWFHPIGLMTGSCYALHLYWGSVLVALVIRFVVLRIGGAMAVRNWLKPFFIGCFTGSVLVALFFHALALYLKSTGATAYGVFP